MTLVMASFHFNIYPIPVDGFNVSLDLLRDYYYYLEDSPKFPYRSGDAFSDAELKLIIRSFPENTTYMVRRSLDCHNVMYSVWLLPASSATSAIEYLINNGLIATDIASRDVRYRDFKDAINDLPYNYHYIVQRYYE